MTAHEPASWFDDSWSWGNWAEILAATYAPASWFDDPHARRRPRPRCCEVRGCIYVSLLALDGFGVKLSEADGRAIAEAIIAGMRAARR